MITDFFVYVSYAESKESRVLKLDSASRKLAPVQELAVSGDVMPMAFSPDRRFLFAALRTSPYSVASFTIDRLSWTLTYLGDAPLPQSALHLSVDAGGRYLFATSIPESKARRHSMLSVTAIGPDGFLHAPQQIIRAEPKIHSILPDPTNRRVLRQVALLIWHYDTTSRRLRVSCREVRFLRCEPSQRPVRGT